MFKWKWAARAVRRSVVVHLTTGQSVRGTLLDTYHDALVLRHSALLGADGAAMDGEIVVPRERVSFVQLLGDTDS